MIRKSVLENKPLVMHFLAYYVLCIMYYVLFIICYVLCFMYYILFTVYYVF